jgi:4-amino-4-deoxy-L-arabinose transferase-like glycosyltransferase
MPRFTSHRAAWILILAVALLARLAAGFWWDARLPPGQQFFFGDSDSYWQLGRAIARGEPYEYQGPDARVLRTPGYPLLLASVFIIGGDEPPVIWARALSAVMGTAAVAVVGWWAGLLFDPRAGIIAGWIASLYPGAVAMSAFVLSEAPFCPFMLAHLALWGLAWRAPTTNRAVWLAAGGGVAGGVATLIRPSWLLFLPFALVIALAFDRKRRRQLLVGAAMAASFAACLLPWWIRNAQLTGRFVPTTLQVGASLYDGLSPTANGSSDMRFVPRFAAAERADERGDEQVVFEVRLDRRMADEAIAWTRANPARALQLAWIKFLRTWNVWPNEPALRSWPVRLVIAGTYVPLLALGLAGAWRYTRRGWPYVLAWLPAVYFTLLHCVFVGSIRYREPAMLPLVVLAAGFVAEWMRRSAEVEAVRA